MLALGGGLILATTQVSYMMAGLLYLGIYGVVAWSQPALALMLVVALAPFQHDLSIGGPIKFSIAELNVCICGLVLITKNVFRLRSIRMGLVLLPVSLYLAICYVSSFSEWRGTDGVKSFLQMIIYLLVAVTVFASYVDHPSQCLPALYGLVVSCTVVAIAQILGTDPYVLGLHKNGAGASASIGLIVATELWFSTKERGQRVGLLIACGILASGLVHSLSRGAWLSAVAGVFIVLAMRREMRRMLTLAIVCLPILLISWATLSNRSRQYAFEFGPEARSIKARLTNAQYAWDQFLSNPVIGVGLGLRKEYDATNLVLSTLAETGILGFGAFGLIYLVFFGQAWKAQSYVLPTDLMFTLIAVGVALTIRQLAHGMVDHYWSRGVLMTPWACVGMATFAYLQIKGSIGHVGKRRAS